jgi:hypothetical protein
MDKEFVAYQPSLELKELGFDEPCFGYYHPIHNELFLSTMYRSYYPNNAPLYQQAFRWFREKQFMMSYIYYDVEYKFCFCIGYNDKIKGFKTYEEAELACLNKLIEIVKTQNHG